MREPGRPRQFSDEEAFRGTAQAVSRLGYRGLTMNAVAKVVGCTGPALIHRFGSKQGLLLVYLDWSIERSNLLFEKSRREYESPLDALISRFADPAHRHNADDAGHSAHVVFFVEGRIDPAFVPEMRRYTSSIVRGIESLLDDAVARGELERCHPADLSQLVLAAVVGASLMWTEGSERPLSESVGRLIEAVLAPYRLAHVR